PAAAALQLSRHRGMRPAAGRSDRPGQLGVRSAVPDLGVRPFPYSVDRRDRAGDRAVLRSRRLFDGGRLDHADHFQHRSRQQGRDQRGGSLMEAAFAITLGVLVASGVYLMLRARVYPVVLGLALVSFAVNLFLLAMGRLRSGVPAIIGENSQYADPLPQALVLTAIVIGFAMTAFVLVLALRALGVLKTDHVDGEEPRE